MALARSQQLAQLAFEPGLAVERPPPLLERVRAAAEVLRPQPGIVARQRPAQLEQRIPLAARRIEIALRFFQLPLRLRLARPCANPSICEA